MPDNNTFRAYRSYLISQKTDIRPEGFFRRDIIAVLRTGTGEQYEGTNNQQTIFVDADPPSSQLKRLIRVWAA